jgi:endonuclease/exonuclease/phosphatase family metal-dependent hydrolase
MPREAVVSAAAEAPARKPAGALRVVSLNTWKCDGDYLQRLPIMASGLRALEPDIVVLQEVFRSIDGRWDTAAYLAESLHMRASCSWARRKPRWLQEAWHDSESGMAMLCKRPVREQWALRLPSSEHDGERTAQLFAFDDAAETFWLANLHLTHLPDAHALRLEQWRAVWSHAALAKLSGSLWMVGDFNTALAPARDWLEPPAPWRAEDTFAKLQQGHKVTHQGEDGTLHNLDQCLRMWRGDPGKRKAVNAQVVLQTPDAVTGLPASDHFGLCIDWCLAGAAQ